jgi:hypothetical protein
LEGKFGEVLGIFKNGHAFEMGVGGDTGEALQELVSLDGHIAERGIAGGDKGVPYGVDVEDGAGFGTSAVEDQMEGSFGGGVACAGKDVSGRVDFEQAGGGESSLVEAAGGDKDAIVDTHAEVAAGSRDPALGVAPASCDAEGFGDDFEGGSIGDHA